MKVIADPGLQPVRNAKGDIVQTFCNFGVIDILNAGNDNTLNGKTANQIFDYLSNSDNASILSYEEAVKYAGEGVTVILASKEENGSGHVAVVAPGEMVSSGSWGKKVPQVFNVGKKNAMQGANYSFSKKNQPTAFIFNSDKKAADTRMAQRSVPSNSLLKSFVKNIWGWGPSPKEMWESMHNITEKDKTNVNQ